MADNGRPELSIWGSVRATRNRPADASWQWVSRAECLGITQEKRRGFQVPSVADIRVRLYLVLVRTSDYPGSGGRQPRRPRSPIRQITHQQRDHGPRRRLWSTARSCPRWSLGAGSSIRLPQLRWQTPATSAFAYTPDNPPTARIRTTPTPTAMVSSSNVALDGVLALVRTSDYLGSGGRRPRRPRSSIRQITHQQRDHEHADGYGQQLESCPR